MGLQKKLEALQYIVLSKKFLHSKYNKKTQDGGTLYQNHPERAEIFLNHIKYNKNQDEHHCLILVPDGLTLPP